MARLRWISRLMVPWWLYVDQGQKVVYVYSLLVDAFRQKLRDGLEARFPSRAGEDAAKLIGADRLILRGRDETLPHYASRLKAWRGQWGHRVRGNAFSLLAQIYYYWGDLACWVVDRNQNRRGRATDGTESYEYGYAWDWDGGAASNWGRFWVVVNSVAVEEPDATGLYLHWSWPEGATDSSGYCTSWVDQVQSIDLTAAGIDRPVYGNRGPEFDGATDYLVSSGIGAVAIPLHTEATFIVAGRRNDDDTATQDLLRTCTQSSAQVGFNLSVAQNAPWLRVLNGTGTPYYSVGWPSTRPLASGDFVVVAGFDATEGYLAIDGDVETDVPTGSPSVAAATGELAILWWNQALDCTIYEVLIFDRKLSLAEAELWRIHMVAKHGIKYASRFAAQDDFGDTIGIAGSTPQDWVAMRRLVDADDQHRWVPAGVQPEWLIVSLDGSWPKPDGGQARWGMFDGTDYVPSRQPHFRYVALRDELRLYAGDPTCWANAFVTPYYGSISGDETQFPTTLDMPDGSTYAGNPANFPAQLRIPDDGDLPG